MLRKLFFITCLFIGWNSLQAQIDYSISGYVQNFPIVSFTPSSLANEFEVEKQQFNNLTRLRLRPVVNLWDGGRLNIEYEAAGQYFNSPSSFISSGSGKTNRQIMKLSWAIADESNLRITHFIDRLYYKQSFESGNIIIGRQRIQWGTGRIWNPTDLFNPINPANFYKIEKDGADAVSLKYFFGSFTDLNVVFNSKERLKESNFGARFRTNIGEYDLSLMGGKFDDRIVAGTDFAGNLLNAGVRGEALLSFDKNDLKNNFAKFIVGIDAQFTSEWYSVVEYHYNGQGVTDTASYDFAKLISGNILNFNRNYIHTGFLYQYSPLLNFTFGNMLNLNDGSGILSLSGSYSITEDIFVNAGGQLSYGSERSEFWHYGSSVYLQGEIYF